MVKLADTLTPRDSIFPPNGVGENDAAIGESELESLVASLWFWPVGLRSQTFGIIVYDWGFEWTHGGGGLAEFRAGGCQRLRAAVSGSK